VQVLPGGPAFLGGLARSDTIVAIDGRSVTVREIQPAIMAHDVPGSRIVVTVEGPDGRERDAVCYRASSEKMKPVTHCFELIAALQQKVAPAPAAPGRPVAPADSGTPVRGRQERPEARRPAAPAARGGASSAARRVKLPSR
jgi:hypothetical protein